MSMGPFSINSEGAKYLIKNRWGDLIREDWSHEAAAHWVDDWYTTRALEDKFLHTDIHVRLLNRKNRIKQDRAKALQKARYVKAHDRLGFREMTLSCGYVTSVQRVA